MRFIVETKCHADIGHAAVLQKIENWNENVAKKMKKVVKSFDYHIMLFPLQTQFSGRSPTHIVDTYVSLGK